MAAQDPSHSCLIALPAAALSQKRYSPRVLNHWERSWTAGQEEEEGRDGDIFMSDLPWMLRSWGLFL